MTGIRAWVHPEDFGAALGELSDSYARQWQDQLNDCGSAQLAVDLDDGDLALVQRGRIVRFDLADTPVFAAIVEHLNQRTISDDEELGENVTVTGRGTLAVFERMVVYPEAPLEWQPVADDRLFTFAAIGFDDSGWANAVETAGEFADVQGWTDPTAEFIWDRSQAGVGVYAPGGDVYFRKAFTTADEHMVEVRAAADDAFDVFVDAVRLGLTGGPIATGISQSTQFRLSAGDHVIAVKATNANALKAWLKVTMLEVNADGTLGALVVHTDDTWLCDGYPATPPGYTPGAIIRILLEEAQARGALLDVTLGFDDTEDSDATPWADAPDVAFRVGLDGLSAFRQLAETYCDVTMATDALRLDAWVAGGRGGATGVELEPAVNLAELVHETA